MDAKALQVELEDLRPDRVDAEEAGLVGVEHELVGLVGGLGQKLSRMGKGLLADAAKRVVVRILPERCGQYLIGALAAQVAGSTRERGPVDRPVDRLLERDLAGSVERRPVVV